MYICIGNVEQRREELPLDLDCIPYFHQLYTVAYTHEGVLLIAQELTAVLTNHRMMNQPISGPTSQELVTLMGESYIILHKRMFRERFTNFFELQ